MIAAGCEFGQFLSAMEPKATKHFNDTPKTQNLPVSFAESPVLASWKCLSWQINRSLTFSSNRPRDAGR